MKLFLASTLILAGCAHANNRSVASENVQATPVVNLGGCLNANLSRNLQMFCERARPLIENPPLECTIRQTGSKDASRLEFDQLAFDETIKGINSSKDTEFVVPALSGNYPLKTYIEKQSGAAEITAMYSPEYNLLILKGRGRASKLNKFNIWEFESQMGFDNFSSAKMTYLSPTLQTSINIDCKLSPRK
ncbi:MAG: hypothetical protein ACK5OB_16450 [Pirellula sp.]